MLDKYKDLKLQLDGFLKPGEQHKRNVLLDSVYASLPKDSQAKVFVFSAEIVPGGYTNWRRLAALAHVYSVDLGHHEEPQVASHLLASQPHGTYVEVFHPDRDPVWWNLIANRPGLVDGQLPLSDAPGLGWVLDPDYIEHHRVNLG